MPLVSVSIVIPTCGRPALLKKAVESVLAQDYPGIKEIIITDDAEIEKQTLDKILSFDLRIKYFKNTRYKKGPAGNKQNGLDMAGGDFIGVLDDDDELFPQAVSCLMEEASKGKYEVVFANCVRSDNGLFTGRHRGKDEEVSYRDFICGFYEGEYWALNSLSLMRKIKLLDEYGGAEGLGWLGIYREEKTRLYYLHRTVKKHNIHPGQFSNTYEKNPVRTFNSYKKYLELFGADIRGICPDKFSYLSKITAYFAWLAGEKREALEYSRLSWESRKSASSLFFYLFSLLPGGFWIIKTAIIIKRALK